MMGAWRALRRFWESDRGLSVLLLAGVAAPSTHRAVRAVLFVLVGGALVVRWGPFSDPATAAAALVTVMAMTFVVLAQAFRAGPVNVHRRAGHLLLVVATVFWSCARDSPTDVHRRSESPATGRTGPA